MPHEDWLPVEGEGFAFEQAVLDEKALAEALGMVSARLVRHRPGQFGLPPLGEGTGFVIDLNQGWPSHHGGLLLFQDGDRVTGFRPEFGMITAFDMARPPILTLVAPQAEDRLAVIGRLA